MCLVSLENRRDEMIMGLRIRGIETYYPDNYRNTDEIIEEFRERGEDITFQVKETLGKEKLCSINDKNENGLTMGIKAAKKVLETTEISGNEIDMIVFSTAIPEYFSPLCSLVIHSEIRGKEEAICYDINANCIGMSLCLERISKEMEIDSKLNKVLIVGSDYLSIHTSNRDKVIYPAVGDMSCAIILEKTQDDSGIIASKHYTDTKNDKFKQIMYPFSGMSNIRTAKQEDTYGGAISEVEVDLKIPLKQINDILEESNIPIEDITLFCFSQHALYYTEYLKQMLDIPDEKVPYIGDVYGYGGTSSPFIALNEMVKKEMVKKGDYVLFWTVGAGYQYITILMKY